MGPRPTSGNVAERYKTDQLKVPRRALLLHIYYCSLMLQVVIPVYFLNRLTARLCKSSVASSLHHGGPQNQQRTPGPCL